MADGIEIFFAVEYHGEIVQRIPMEKAIALLSEQLSVSKDPTAAAATIRAEIDKLMRSEGR